MDKVAFEIALAVRDIHTTAQLSGITGISRQTLAAIRSQKTEASQESAEQIRRTLDLTSDEYSKIFPMQAEITAVKEKYLTGASAANV